MRHVSSAPWLRARGVPGPTLLVQKEQQTLLRLDGAGAGVKSPPADNGCIRAELMPLMLSVH